MLFYFLRVHNVELDYEDLVKEQMMLNGTASYSANTLVDLSSKNGVALNVRSLTMRELELCERPVIAYMTSIVPDDGGFIPINNMTDSEVVFIDGASATMQSLSREDFSLVLERNRIAKAF